MNTVKTQKVIHVVEEKDMGSRDDAPNVVAYRVGKLEEAVRDGFEKQTQHIDEIVKGFVTEKEMTTFKEENDKEHENLWAEVNKIKAWGTWAVRTVGVALILAMLGLLGIKARML